MGKKRTKEELKRLHDYAKVLCVREKLSQKEAAIKVGVTTKTMNTWYNDGGWSKLGKNLLLTREEQMTNLLNELTEFNAAIQGKPEGQRFASSKEADARRKLIKDIKDLETKAAIPEIIHSCQGLLEFVRKIDLFKAQELSGYVDSYIKSRL